MIRRTATEAHSAYRKDGEKAQLQYAEAYYGAYLTLFLAQEDPRGETPEIEMYLAEVKRDLGKSQEASELYRKVVDSRDKRYAKEAGALWTASLADAIKKQGNAGNAANAALAPQGNAGNAANAALAPQGNASLEPQTNASIDSSEDGDDAVPMYGGGANSAFSEGSLDIGDGELYLTLASMFKSAQGESLADILSSIAKSLQTLVLNKDGAAEEAE